MEGNTNVKPNYLLRIFWRPSIVGQYFSEWPMRQQILGVAAHYRIAATVAGLHGAPFF